MIRNCACASSRHWRSTRSRAPRERQRRLRRMIDALERQLLDPAAPGYAVHDRYVARLLDAFDLMAAAYRLAR